MQIESPCFDRFNKKDCPKRHAGCSVDCPEWANYCKLRNEAYDKQKASTMALTAMYDCRNKRYDKRQKKNISDRQNKFKRRYRMG